MAAAASGRAAATGRPENLESLLAGDEFVGNVHDVCPTCKGATTSSSTSSEHTARASSELVRDKGQLIFNAAFDSGNLGRVDKVSSFEYDFFIRPDTCNTKYQVWFYFSVRNVRRDQRVLFNIVNFSKMRSLYRDGMTPVIWSTSRPYWIRLPSETVFYYRCPDHNFNYILTMAFMFDNEEDEYKFAYCFPYSYTELQHYLSLIGRKRLAFYRRELLGVSVQRRRVDLITITHPDNLRAGSARKMKCVVVTARVHPGETPSSYVCQGLIDFLISDQPEAKQLRDKTIFYIVPMLNPDGVYLGNYRCSLLGFDLNRQWDNPLPWAQPTIYAVRKFVFNLDKEKRTELCYVIDLHAHSTLLNAFMYGNVYDDDARSSHQVNFPRLVHARCPSFSMSQTAFNRDPIKIGTARRHFGGYLRLRAKVYTLEVSFLGATPLPSSSNKIEAYTPATYASIGQDTVKALADALA